MQKILVLMFLIPFIFQSTVASAKTDENLSILEAHVGALKNYLAQLSVQWNPATQKPVSNDKMKTVILNGVSWFINAQEANGHFAYEYLPFEDRYREDDNIVRQAGTLYVLGEVVRKSRNPNKDTNQAIEKAIGYFESLSPEHEFEGKTLRCVTKNEHSKVCKLGATTLALIGILDYVEANPKKADTYDKLIKGYVTFILESKKSDAGFRDQYQIGSGFRGETESSFSNGEALLALVRYSQFSERTDVKKVIDTTFLYLQKQPFDANLYLWMMAALKDMQTSSPSEAYTTYGKAFTFWRVDLMQQQHNSTHNYCPANEGFASAYSLLKETLTIVEEKKLRTEIDFWNTKHIGLQIGTEESERVVFENGKMIFRPILNVTQSAGGFLTGETEVTQRIDFTQHCVNAYLQTMVDIDGQQL